jgi:hypothetical protein
LPRTRAAVAIALNTTAERSMGDTTVSSSSGVGAGTVDTGSASDNTNTAANTAAANATPGEQLANQTTPADALRNEPTFAERMTGGMTPTDAAEAGAQGVTGLAAREGIQSKMARDAYNTAAHQLDPTDVAGRTALKAATREATPPVTRAIVNAVRPDLGPRPGSVASANKPNVGANALAGRLGMMGRANAVLGVGLGAYRVATAENKLEESARVAGGVLGGIGAGALVGAQLGAMGANPVTIGVGAVVGGIVGGIAGEAAVNHAIGWVKSWF